jgi:multidrug efflux system membrane fusion protein
MNTRIESQPEKPSAPPQEDRDNGHEPSRRRWVWVAVLVLVVVVGAVVYIRHSKAASQAQNAAGARKMPPIPVTAAQAKKGDIGVYITGLGSVTPLYTVSVRTRVDGQLMKVLYKEGDTVQKGKLLAVIDPRPFEVQLVQAEGQLAKDQATLANARTDLDRYEALIKRNAVAEQVLATQRATVTQDEGVIKTDQGAVDAAKLNLVYCNITAPITGRIGLRLVDPGNFVQASSTNPLLVITQIEPISVIFTISEDQVPIVAQKFRAGQAMPVTAYDRNLTTKIATGKLETMDNQIDQTTGTLRLRAVFDNKDHVLFPNQFVNAQLLVDDKHGVTLVPNAGIQRNGTNTFVYLVKPDGAATIRQVTIGTGNSRETEVVSGLQPGDVVVTMGVDKLQEGSKVQAQIINPSGPGQGQQTVGQAPQSGGNEPQSNGQGHGAGSNGAGAPSGGGHSQVGGRSPQS